MNALIPLISQTLRPLMRMLMLNFCHFRIHDLMRAKVTRLVPPITLISGLSPSLTVAPDLTPDVLVGGQAWAPPIIQQLVGGWLVMETSLDYGN